MSKDVQNRIDAIVEFYFSKVHADENVISRFHDWFGNDGHIEEKYRALKSVFENRLGFDENPSPDITESFNEICRKLGLPEYTAGTEGTVRSGRGIRLNRGLIWRAAAVLLPPLAVLSIWALSLADHPKDTVVADGMRLAVPHQETVIEANTSFGTQILSQDIKRNISLPDNSNVWINENSSLEYDEDFDNNRVVALDGEAYFNVTEKGEHNFVVRADGLKAIVTGTSFNVQSYPKASTILISLYEGSLEVDRFGKKYYLSAGQELEYNKVNSEITIEPIRGFLPAWLDNVVGFRNTKVAEIFEKLELVYNIPIVVDGDAELAGEYITIYFEQAITLDDLMSMMSRLSNRFTHKYDKEHNSILIVSK